MRGLGIEEGKVMQDDTKTKSILDNEDIPFWGSGITPGMEKRVSYHTWDTGREGYQK